MWELGCVHRKLLVWCLVGVVLDTAAFIGFWVLLNTLGPLNPAAEAWLIALALITVPWLVHVVALPALFRVRPKNWTGSVRLAAETLVFISVGGMLIPLLGMMIFLFSSLLFGLVYQIAIGQRPPIFLGSPTLADQIISYVVWTAIATIVAAAVGLLLHGLGSDSASRARRPSLRSDVFGAVIAAFVAFSGMFAASALGLFSREVPNDKLHLLSIAPQLPATLVIGIMALLPHLFMVGLDLLGRNVIQQEGTMTAGNR